MFWVTFYDFSPEKVGRVCFFFPSLSCRWPACRSGNVEHFEQMMIVLLNIDFIIWWLISDDDVNGWNVAQCRMSETVLTSWLLCEMQSAQCNTTCITREMNLCITWNYTVILLQPTVQHKTDIKSIAWHFLQLGRRVRLGFIELYEVQCTSK